MRLKAAFVCIASLLGACGTLLAQPIVPLGSEFQVNSYTTNFQRAPRLAVNASGAFVVVWESRDQDYAGYGVFAQRYDSSGAAVGAELQVHSDPAGDQLAADVALADDGSFLVVWNSSQSSGSDSDNRSIQLRRFDATATPQHNDLQVNTDTTGVQQAPAVAQAPDGSFLVVWEGLDGDGDGVRGQFFAANGSATGGEFAVNAYTTQDQNSVAVTRAGDEFVVVWQSATSPDDTDGYALRGRRVSSTGAPLGAEFQVNGSGSGDQLEPSIAGADDGGFVVSWHRFSGGGAASEIFARRFGSGAAALDGDFQVNSYTTGSQRGSAVAVHASGNFVVTWGSNGSPDSDSDGYSVRGRLVSPGGALLGDAFQVNTYTTSYQTAPHVGVDDAGRFMVAWSSFQNIGFEGGGSEASDIQSLGVPDDRGVRGQRLELRTFDLAWTPLVGTTVGEIVSLDLTLASGVYELASLAFSIDYDATCLEFDSSDLDMDNIPDALTFNVPGAFDVSVTFDAGDTDGEIDVLIADVPPVATLDDGVIASLELTVTCSAGPGSQVDAGVSFSQDPPISGGDVAAQSLPAQGSDGVVRVLPGPRGDCNGDRAVDAADLGASGLELFDGDGDVWLDVAGGSFVGSAVGCDANRDTVVDAGDVSCIERRIFAAPCSEDALIERPALRLPETLAVDIDDTVTATLFFTPDGASINSLALSIDFDQTLLSFDPTDADMDGVPDAVTPVGAMPGIFEVTFDGSDTDGELDILWTDAAASPQVLTEGPLLEIQWQSLTPQSSLLEAVVFAAEPAVSFGDVEGRSVAGDARVSPPVLFADGFESGGTVGWSTSQP